jgi:hypothetical protein
MLAFTRAHAAPGTAAGRCRFLLRKSPYVQAKIQPRNRISVTAIASSKALSRSIVASLRSVEGRSRGSVAPVLKKVFVELLTLTQPPGLRCRAQWLRWFDCSNPADHTDAGNRDYKNNHRDHQRHMVGSIHDRSLRPSGHREYEGRHTTSGGLPCQRAKGEQARLGKRPRRSGGSKAGLRDDRSGR